MALIGMAADKGAPGVTTSAVALSAVWPRPVLLAECDPAGGDLGYWLPNSEGGRLDPHRGLLSMAVAARRGVQPDQVWEHTQKLHGGLDVLAGVTTAEQGAGLEPLWGSVGLALSRLPRADVIADCGRIGPDGPQYDLLAHASLIVLITRDSLGEMVRLRDRIVSLAAALARRERGGVPAGVVVIAERKRFHAALAEVGQALGRGEAGVIGGLAYEPATAAHLRGEWSGKLDRSLLVRTARAVAGQLAAALPTAPGTPNPSRPAGSSVPPRLGVPTAPRRSAGRAPLVARSPGARTGRPARHRANAAARSDAQPLPGVLRPGARRAWALPSGALPSGALPSRALPSGALPSGALRADPYWADADGPLVGFPQPTVPGGV